MNVINKNKTKILNIIGNLPPKQSKHIFLTEDQERYWDGLKEFWLMNHYGLELYFSGKSVPKGLKDRFHLEEPAPELILRSIRVNLKLYELLNFGWEEIMSQAKSENIDFPFEEPGEAFSWILKEISVYSFKYCLMPYNEFSPRKIYKAVCKEDKLLKKESKGIKLNNLETQWRENLDTELRRNMPDNGNCAGFELRDFCLKVCSQNTTSNLLIDTYKEYRMFEKQMMKIVKREESGKGCLKKEVWLKGKYFTN